MNRAALRSLCLLLLLTTVAASGCTSLNFKKLSEFNLWKKPIDELSRPVRMVAIWTDAVNYTPGQEAMRGFGGRLYFYDAQGRAVAAEGELVVYAFDDNQPADTQRPDRKFAFTAAQFAERHSLSTIGDSYSVWLPWDPAGGNQREISLIPIFRPVEGDVVIGEQTRHVLRGTDLQSQPGQMLSPQTPVATPAVQQAGFAAPGASGVAIQQLGSTAANGTYVAAGSNPAAESGRMRTTTIPVPKSLSDQISPTARAEAINEFSRQFRERRAQQASQAPFPESSSSTGQAATAIDDPYSAAATPPATQPTAGFQMPAPTRFERPRRRALGLPIESLNRGPAHWQRGPAAPGSSLPVQP